MYSPKIESRAEDWFYHEFHKRTCARINPQVEVDGGSKSYRLDFVVDNRDCKIGVEIDGKDYHDEDSDFLRDKDILKNNPWLHSIVRFDAHDLMFNAPLVTLHFCEHHPEFIFRISKPDKSYHVSEVRDLVGKYWEGESERIDSVHSAFKRAAAYLKTLSVYEIEHLSRNVFEAGYIKTGYCVRFMTHEKHTQFQEDQYNHDPDLDQEYPNPVDYCYKKFSTVREVANG